MADTPNSRERMLEAAIAVIETDGEAGVRVDRIAEKANVAKPSLYHFFKNRDGLIIAAQAERYRRSLVFGLHLLVEPVQRARSRDEFASLLRNVIRSFRDPAGVARRRQRIQVLGSAASRPELRRMIREAEDQAAAETEAVFRVAQQRGWITTHFDLSIAVRWWFGVILGRHLIDDVFDDDQSAQWDDIALEALEHILFGTPPAR